MKSWVESYIKSVVDHPDHVTVNQIEGHMTIVLDVKVNEADASQFAGKNNRLTRALSAVAGLAGTKIRKRYIVKVAH